MPCITGNNSSTPHTALPAIKAIKLFTEAPFAPPCTRGSQGNPRDTKTRLLSFLCLFCSGFFLLFFFILYPSNGHNTAPCRCRLQLLVSLRTLLLLISKCSLSCSLPGLSMLEYVYFLLFLLFFISYNRLHHPPPAAHEGPLACEASSTVEMGLMGFN